jgi:hypothetical protein
MFTLSPDGKFLLNHPNPAIESVNQRLAAIVADFDMERAAIANNRDLTPTGKNSALQAARQRHMEKVAPIRAEINGLADRLAATRNNMKGITPVTDTLQFLRQQEIRNQLKALDPIERNAYFARNTDPEVFQAVADDPARLLNVQLVADDAFKAGFELVQRTLNPDVSAQLDELLDVRQAYVDAVTAAEGHLGQEAPPAVDIVQ